MQGCFLDDEPIITDTGAVTPEFPDVSPTAIPTRNPSNPGDFTIRYDPDSVINPITSLSRDNIVISSLLYEPLFTLTSRLEAETVLCEDWSTEDWITYSFDIKENIAMSDGSMLTADDVVYTIRCAMQTGRFVNRLRIISSVELIDDFSLTIELKSANRRFIKLLDIPIIKQGSIDDPIPAGSGPYILSEDDEFLLVRFADYREYDKLQLEYICLFVCNDNEMAELFDGGVLSLLWDDPSDTYAIILNRHNEARYYDTTALQFIGFNARSTILRDADVRRAIGYSINRSHIVDNIMPGQSLAAPLALSPAYTHYDTGWEQTVVDPLIAMSVLFERAGLEDFDNDSYLEYPNGYGGYYEISLDFIVNLENSYKVQTAYLIADTLRLYGIEIIVRELHWDAFMAEISSGTYDMYYGEIVIGADFDISLLVLPNSHLNYGLTGSDLYVPFMDAFMSADNDFDETIAAEALCNAIDLNAPFVPILYKRYVVYTPIGVVTGASPSQSGVFHDISSWTINHSMIP